MRIKLVFFIAALSVAINLMAKPINQNQAMDIAKSFFNTTGTTQPSRVKRNLDYRLIHTEKGNNQQNRFYVFNLGDNNGFIIVSADTRTKSVLGYSNSGKFDVTNMPDNLKSWLTNYSEEIEYAIEKLPETNSHPIAKVKKASASNPIVSPLLNLITYDQDSPYNDFCPKIDTVNTVTGCVATAMAQIMRYHQWPEKGKGSKTYITKTTNTSLSADFGATTYDWSNILTSYNGSETAIQKEAIAQLMLHVGVSVEMDYDLAENGGSGAAFKNCANALVEYFGYDAGIQLYDRNYFTKKAWTAKLKTELDAGRPILYTGSNAHHSGHAFVCDGYDANDMFHFNWGWGGVSNGYYELSALNPKSQGIGSSNGGYNFRQQITAGIQKPIAGSKNGYIMGVDSIQTNVNSIRRDRSVDITIYGAKNIGGYTIQGCRFGCVLTQPGESDILLKEVVNLRDLKEGWQYSAYPMDNITFNDSIPNGNYQLKFVHNDENGNYAPALANNRGFNSIDVIITSERITFKKPNLKPQLQLKAPPTVLYNLYQNRTGVFNFNIPNIGTYEYDSQIGIKLVKKDDPNITQDVVTSSEHIEPGDTLAIQMSGPINVAPGEYFIQVFYDPKNTTKTEFPTTQLGTDQVTVITVSPTPDPASLSTVSMDMPSVTLGKEFTLTASIKNSGGFYDKTITAYVFSEVGKWSVYSLKETAFIENNETKTIKFTGTITGLTPGNYSVYLYSDGEWISSSTAFKIEAPNLTSVSNQKDNTRFNIINPVKEVLRISLPKGVETVYIYNMQGKIVKIIQVAQQTDVIESAKDLQQGMYIVKAIGENINLSAKIVKE